MKANIKILLILLGIIIANILVFCFGADDVIVGVIVVTMIVFHKAFISEKFSDIYNIHTFKYTLSINNLLELVGALLISLIITKEFFSAPDFNILYVCCPVIFGLLIYRFLLFNLSKNNSKG